MSNDKPKTPIKIGDRVRLKSGGPLMTVNGYAGGAGANAMKCAWFVGSDAKEAVFVPEALEQADV